MSPTCIAGIQLLTASQSIHEEGMYKYVGFIYLFILRQSYRERERQTEIFQPLVLSLYGLQQPELGSSKTRSIELHVGLYVGARAQVYGPPPTAFPGPLSGT